MVEEGVFRGGGAVCAKSLNGDEAPGPDGMTLAFFHQCWEHVRVEVMGMFHHFPVHGSLRRV